MAAYTASHSANFASHLLRRVMGKVFDPASTDVKFRFVDEKKEVKTIDAHKKLLSAASPVFEAMFNGNWREKDAVEIVDAKYEVFNEFVQFLYGNEVAIYQGNIDGLVYLAKKYDIEELVLNCTAYIARNARVDTIVHSLDLMVTYDLDGLQNSCAKVISEHTQAILKSPAFLSCKPSVLAKILQAEKMSCTEAEIFDACIEWAKSQCRAKQLEENAENLRKQLGDNLNLIRFNEMKRAEFIERCKLYNGELFSAQQMSGLVVNVFGNTTIKNKRCEKQAEEINYRFAYAGLKMVGGMKCSIRFSTSKPLVLTKFGVANFLVETTDGKVQCPCDINLVLKKYDEIAAIRMSSYKGHTNSAYYALNKECVIKVGREYELILDFVPAFTLGRKFVYEYDSGAQTLNDNGIDLVIHKYADVFSSFSQCSPLTNLVFKKLDKDSLHLLKGSPDDIVI